MKKNIGILYGLNILDCSQILAGPFCSMLLADMGAKVIKVEKPNTGDDTRSWGPPFKSGQSVGFMNLNRNKESIVIDFKNPDGIKVMKNLVKNSDVILENYRTGTMDKLGLGYEELKKVNNKIIYCSISGFGRTGPYAKRAGFDLVAQGMSGLMSITGHAGDAPAKIGVPVADLNTGMFALSSIQAAYINLLKNGVGQYIEVSLLESALAYTVWESTGYFETNDIPGPLGSIYLFDYRALHAGTPNSSPWIRPLLYLVYAQPWFRDSVNFQYWKELDISDEEWEKVPPILHRLFRSIKALPLDSQSEKGNPKRSDF